MYNKILSICDYDKNEKLMCNIKKNSFLFIKRIGDIIFSIIGMILIIPLMAIVKVINMLHGNHESIFYSHERIGKNGKIFKLYKFRTMVPDADKILKEMLKEEKYKNEWDLNQKFENDPRITKVGNFLRKTSLDEFPQFLNIIKGDMSLIGPRPLIKGELISHGGNSKMYESVKPGLTGWWACNGRNDLSYDERLELEYYYVNNISLKLDVECIYRTVKAVVSKKGAK